MSKNVIKLPSVADPNIEEVLGRFLEYRRKELKPSTMRKYESVVELFTGSMNSYAYQYLDERESKTWNHLYDAEGPAHREFCQIFGPEKIPENVGEFLGYFMPRKVVCGRDLLKAAGTVMKKLGKWLAERGYIEDESAERVAERGAAASRDLPAADKVAEMIHHYANSQPVSKWTDEVQDYFTVEEIEPGKLYLSSLTGLGDEIIVLSVPRRISDSCKVGWDISLLLGKSCSGWRIIESGGVYAH